MTLSEVWREAPLVFGCLYLDFGGQGFLRDRGAQNACKAYFACDTALTLNLFLPFKNKRETFHERTRTAHE